MPECVVCQQRSPLISQSLGLCGQCARSDAPEAQRRVAEVHSQCRRRFGLPVQPPRAKGGALCTHCANACLIAPGRRGYCGVRHNAGGTISGGDADVAAVQWYYDPLPTNCVADWVCPASGPAGYPVFTDTRGPERGYLNLGVFYEACSFDCLFCQNWHFKRHSLRGPRHSAAELAAAVTARTRCICFFGGDPSCQVEHALAAARLARQRAGGRFFRVCWETNGSVSRPELDQMVQLTLESGGVIKFDLKAWDEPLHRALCGVSNRHTLDNFRRVAEQIGQRPDPPPLVASTLLVPGYVDETQVDGIARFIAELDASIPYALLAFHPCFAMGDLPVTSRRQAEACLEAARRAGLTRVEVE
ncbi:MAG TPA: radical SAM protein [Planctomycetaceae bacterium]|nr:radical SAM protein [Planctomycetaceae bacterium]